jgi:hypothetical protein
MRSHSFLYGEELQCTYSLSEEGVPFMEEGPALVT